MPTTPQPAACPAGASLDFSTSLAVSRAYDYSLDAPAAGDDCKSPIMTVLHDLDGDGDLDAVVACGISAGFGSRVLVRELDKDAAGVMYYKASGYSTALQFVRVSSVAVADVDGDACPDLVVHDQGQIEGAPDPGHATVHLILGTCDAQVEMHARFKLPEHGPQNAGASYASPGGGDVGLFDLDGDLDLDVVGVTNGHDDPLERVYWYDNDKEHPWGLDMTLRRDVDVDSAVG